jgi:uncharacterized protein with HEPN domain
MSRREPELTLRQIVEFADEVAALVRSRAREDLETNREFRRALERCVELIGEAATRLPEDWRAKHSEIPWRQIIAMRNVMIHGYDEVVDEVLWDVATKDIPHLRKTISALS